MKNINTLRLIIALIFLISVIKGEELTGTNVGAYLKTPDPSGLQYRLGNGISWGESSYPADSVRNLIAYAGYDGMRKKLRADLFDTWGYGIELETCRLNQKYGILDVVGYLAKPPKKHSSNKTEDSEACYPANLYEPIWLDNGKVNPKNYWAYFVNETVTMYKPYIKIWETWNEPDYVRNVDTSKWETEPPNPKDLTHWYGTIFEYIRLLRITYEVAKKADPDCWVATGGLGYPYFLDGIMRYTDNPDNGKLTKEYPAYGGAYFDCDAYHKYPQWGSYDMETKESIDDNGSDSHARKVITLKKNHRLIINKYGFGSKYPEKIYINTETGLNSGGTGIGGDLVRRNWIIKVALMCVEFDIKQLHILNIQDNDGMGDYAYVGKYVSNEEGYTHLKNSSKGRRTLKKMNLGKYIFDEERTKKLRESLQANLTGIVLKRKFPKEENEAYYYQYMYSVWIKCIKNEVEGEIKTKLDIPFDPLKLDWLGNEEKMKSSSEFSLTSTPIFLLGDEKTGLSTFSVVLITFGVLIAVAVLAFLGFHIYRRYIQKKDISIENKDSPLM